MGTLVIPPVRILGGRVPPVPYGSTPLDLLHEADAHLFRKMANNKQHRIHQLLPPTKILPVKLRHFHCFCLPCHGAILTCTNVHLLRSLFEVVFRRLDHLWLVARETNFSLTFTPELVMSLDFVWII